LRADRSPRKANIIGHGENQRARAQGWAARSAPSALRGEWLNAHREHFHNVLATMDLRPIKIGAEPANGVPQGDDFYPNVTMRGPDKKSVKYNPAIVERVERIEAITQAESAEAADLADAMEVQSDSTCSVDAMPVHPREPRVSTCTNASETAFKYANLRGSPDTPQQRTSRGVQAQEEDMEERGFCQGESRQGRQGHEEHQAWW